jgi:hypothetical protein
MQHSIKTPLNPPSEPNKKAGRVASKKQYHKPALKRLGVLKSVAGSGIAW